MPSQRGSRFSKVLWTSLVVLFVIVFVSMPFLSAGNAEEPKTDSEKQAADLQREAEWLVLQAGYYNKETLKADELGVGFTKAMLLQVREKFPEAKDVSVLPAVRDSAIAMTVMQTELGVEVPREILAIAERYGASTSVQYGDKAGDLATVRLYFFKLLHTPSLIAECAKVAGVTNVRDDAAPPPEGMDTITMEHNENGLLRLTLKRVERVEGCADQNGSSAWSAMVVTSIYVYEWQVNWPDGTLVLTVYHPVERVSSVTTTLPALNEEEKKK